MPESLDQLFRRAVSRRFGAFKGSITAGTLAAIARYSGLEPRVAAMATESLVIVDAPPELIGGVLKRLPSKGQVTATAKMSRKEVEEKIGRVTVTYSGRNYVEFRQDVPDVSVLLKLGAFRTEFDGREIIFEEDCLTCTVSGLAEALDIVKGLASALAIALPLSACKRKLELYVWDEPKTHEVIAE
jgi:hypothetical protein